PLVHPRHLPGQLHHLRFLPRIQIRHPLAANLFGFFLGPARDGKRRQHPLHLFAPAIRTTRHNVRPDQLAGVEAVNLVRISGVVFVDRHGDG
ncbi:MAG: hypothetical protein ACK56I_12155, partial [bacterium]